MESRDRAALGEDLFAGYAAFYKVDQTAQIARGPSWLAMDATTAAMASWRRMRTAPSLALPTTAVCSGQSARDDLTVFWTNLFVQPFRARGTGCCPAPDKAVGRWRSKKWWGTCVGITAETTIVAAAYTTTLATRTGWDYDIKVNGIYSRRHCVLLG